MSKKGLPKLTEANFQIAIAKYLDAKKVTWCHVPNGIYSNPINISKFKKQGLKPGIPDVLIFESDGRNFWDGFAVELKIGNNKPNQNQIRWMQKLNQHGWLCVWCNDLDSAIDAIDKYIAGETTTIEKKLKNRYYNKKSGEE